MYIATIHQMVEHSDIIAIFPPDIKRCLYSINIAGIQEIRLAMGQTISLVFNDGQYYLNSKGVLSLSPVGGIKIKREMLDFILEKISRSSLYSVTDELKYGYITMSGGHRIGITGTAVIKNGEVEFIKNISAMNIRIANEMIGIADKLVREISDDGVKNTLIISPPGCGKTTLLRDTARWLSDRGYSVAIADERCELAGMYEGKAGFNIGCHSVVMEACPKAYAMDCLVRTMSPEVIITDELGSVNDINAVYNAINSGVSVIATAHGRDIKQLSKRSVFKKLLPLFDVVVTLSKREGVGTVENIIYNE